MKVTAARLARRAASRDARQTVPYQMRRMPLALSDRLALEALRRRTTKEAVVVQALTIGLKVMEVERDA